MNCPTCKAEVPDDVLACPECGALIGEADAAAAAEPFEPGKAEGLTGATRQPESAAPAPTQPPAAPEEPPEAPPSLGAPTVAVSAAVKSFAESPQVAEARQLARAGLLDGLSVLRQLLPDPVGRLAPVGRDLGARRALYVGLVYAVAVALAIWIGFSLLMRGAPGSGVFDVFGLFFSPSAATWIKLLVFGLVPFASLLAAVAVARTALQASGLGLGGDSYVAGVSLLPFGVFMLVAGLLGPAVPEVAAALLVVALCFNILLLFKGCTDIAGISERNASLTVPLMLLLAGWISSVIFRALL